MHGSFEHAGIVLFYANWSAHSKALLPIWDEAARHINETHHGGHHPVHLLKVDAGARKDIMDDMLLGQVISYPAIKLFREGGVHELEKHGRELRTVEAIVEEVRRQGHYKRPEFLQDSQAALKFVKEEDCAIISLFKGDVVGKAALKIFEEAAFELAGRCSFAWTAGKPAIAAMLDYKGGYPGLLLKSKGYLRTRTATYRLRDDLPDVHGSQLLNEDGSKELEAVVEWFHANP